MENVTAVQLKTQQNTLLLADLLCLNPCSSDTKRNNSLCTWIAGAADRASVKQTMHISSASCFRHTAVLSQPCRQGRHISSFFTPPHGWPHGWVLLQASFAYSYAKEVKYIIMLERPSDKINIIAIFKAIPDNLGLNTHFPQQIALFRFWCHRSGRHLNCWKLVYLSDNKITLY